MYDILTFGASIDELNTEAIQQAIDAAASDRRRDRSCSSR